MLICRNNQTMKVPLHELHCFRELLEQLSLQAISEGESILSVKVDGEELSELESLRFDQLPLQKIKRLEIQTGDPHGYARSTLYSTAPRLEKLLTDLEITSELLRLGNAALVDQALFRCVTGIQSFMQTLERCRCWLGISFELFSVPRNVDEEVCSVAQVRRALLAVLDDILQAHTDRDWELMADLIQYELLPKLETWRHVISALLQHIHADVNRRRWTAPVESLTAYKVTA